MIHFEPYEIDPSDMTSTATISYDAAYFGSAWQGEWVAGTYDEGDIVWEGVKIYESAIASNTDQPSTGVNLETPTWINRGHVNPWRMFDFYVGTDQLSITESSSPLEVIIATDQIDHIGLFNINADSILVEVLDDEDNPTWSCEYNLLDDALSISDWYEYFYIPYPPVERDLVIPLKYMTSTTAGEQVKITLVRNGGVVSCSNCFVGFAKESGKTQWDVDIKAYNTGDTITDDWGRTSFLSGKNYKVVSATVRPLTGSVNYILRQLSDLQNKPVVFDFNNDGTDYDILRSLGAITSISQILIGPNDSTIDIEIRGIVKKE